MSDYWWNAVIPGAPEWRVPAALAAGAIILLVFWAYRRAAVHGPVRVAAATLKILAITALAVCLIEPLYRGTKPRPGANVFIVAADNSRSLQILDRSARTPRQEEVRRELDRERPWLRRLEQDFEVRRFIFDSRVRPVRSFEDLDFLGSSSSLFSALAGFPARYGTRPVAGVMVLTDGNATDAFDEAASLRRRSKVPVYPVMIGKSEPPRDLRVTRVSSVQSNFEIAPVSVTAEVIAEGFPSTRDPLIVQLLNEGGQAIDEQTIEDYENGQASAVRFQLKPTESGISFYRVRAVAKSDLKRFDLEHPEKVDEATLINNERGFLVDRAGGPYRVLYVTGRANWEFKFLRRALDDDEEIQLVGLVRIAKREPKFSFRSRDDSNPIYRGFGNEEDEETEQYDQPVLLRLGTEDGEELRDGFPKTAEDLFRYHAIVLDDLEAEFFTQDQQTLVQQFVTRRGGGFLMLGGQESFAKGKYDRSPIGEMLPVYLDRLPPIPSDRTYRLALTKEGWLEPWVRVRSTQEEERSRLVRMPELRTVNRIRGIKPGATVLAQVESQRGERYPALVVQPFGQGRAAALLAGDLWRWAMRRPDPEQEDLYQSWRQTARWLVADVPQRVEATAKRDSRGNREIIRIVVRDASFRPLDNAQVEVTVKTPDGRSIELKATGTDTSGTYETTFVSRVPGGYRADVEARTSEDELIGTRQTGWVSDPAVEEFSRVESNGSLLRRIAEDTGGEVLQLGELDAFVESLPNRKIPEIVSWTYPLWHQWSVFVFAIACLAGEWGLRRWKGLP